MATDYREKDELNTEKQANLVGVRYFDTRRIEQHPIFKDLLSNEDMYKWHVVPLSNDSSSKVFAITIQTPTSAKEVLKNMYTDSNVTFVMISEAGFKEFMKIYDPPEEVVYNDITIAKEDDQDKISEISKTLEGVHADDIFNYLIDQAFGLGASDIHLETNPHGVRIRFRTDGVLHIIANVGHDKYRQLMSTIAIQANISTSASEAQTGHINYIVQGDKDNNDINMRIETVPTVHGQDAVIRIFNFDESLLNLDSLGLSKKQQETINDVIKHPEGLVMSVGPTGSGKTTTLYSIIKALNTPTRKIITLEDPVEYQIHGITQIPVDTRSGQSFAEALKAVLRLDPDVVMVGEIRDIDTAKTALQAALSGHLVLSTFHANNAPAALDRLLDMVGENPLLPSAIRLIIAQRLIRTLDMETREETVLDESIQKTVEQIISKIPIENEKPDTGKQLYKPGISEDSPFGFKGQTVALEQLKMTPNIVDLLRLPLAEITVERITQEARKDGMITMLEDGIKKAYEGTTTIEEVLRVVG